MHSVQIVLTSTCDVQHNGHIRVTNKTSVKSSKVGTIVPCNHDVKLCVIVPLSPVFMAKHTSEQQVASGFVPQGMVT